MNLLGLDLASRLSGWCCGDGSEPPLAGAWPFEKVTTEGDGADYGHLLSQLYGYLEVTFRRFPDIVAVGYEAPILITRRKNKSSDDEERPPDSLWKLRLLYPLGAFTEWYCRDIAKVPCHEITVQEAKSEVTNNRHAEKEDIARIAEKCGVVLPKVGRLDAGDSFAVWKRLLRGYNKEASARWDKLIFTPQGALL
jgi:hypothetical protein